MISPNFLSVQTDSAGSAWAGFPSHECGVLSVLNNSGTSIRIRRKGESDADKHLLIKDGQAWSVSSITNADQIEVRREDESTDQVRIHAEAE